MQYMGCLDDYLFGASDTASSVVLACFRPLIDLPLVFYFLLKDIHMKKSLLLASLIAAMALAACGKQEVTEATEAAASAATEATEAATTATEAATTATEAVTDAAATTTEAAASAVEAATSAVEAATSAAQ
jgi:hypothetical protein